jgi:hypothetical protein
MGADSLTHKVENNKDDWRPNDGAPTAEYIARCEMADPGRQTRLRCPWRRSTACSWHGFERSARELTEARAQRGADDRRDYHCAIAGMRRCPHQGPVPTRQTAPLTGG